MTNKILQWNIRGIKANLNELILLIAGICPAIICLQETFLKENNTTNIKHYTFYNYINKDTDRASGGTSILVKNEIPQRPITINTNLQAIAVSVTLHRTITLCSIYIPPKDTIHETELTQLIKQLPKPFILLGDFNSNNVIWGSKETNKKGKEIENIINKNNLCLLNNQNHTYMYPATGTFTAIDLTLCDPSIYMDYNWKVHNDTCGSDHFPIILESSSTNTEQKTPKWNLHKANWEDFQEQCQNQLIPEKKDEDDHLNYFIKTLTNIANNTIPKTTNTNSYNKPWFTKECREAIRARRAAFRKFKKNPTSENLDFFKNNRAKARRIMKESKRTTWRNYVSKININTKTKKVWNMMRKIEGKCSSTPIPHISMDNKISTNQKDISNSLADNFSKISSSDKQTEKFKKIREREEKKKIQFKSQNTENYNQHLTMTELKESLAKAHDTATGPDEIPYELLKKLPATSMKYLLEIFNIIWTSGNIPRTWKEATIIPIPKSQNSTNSNTQPQPNNTSDPLNFRPIALTSCICKTMERIINKRLVWFLETENLITEFQSGFRKNRSPMDHLVRLETFIREAFLRKEHLTAIFFDIEKAYDTVWKYGVTRDLKELGLKGRMPIFIENFLRNRQFRVKIGTTLSDLKEQENGVPQGSILSVTLFSIRINHIVKNLNPGIDCSLYVDDFLICCRSKYIPIIERKLQLCLNKVTKWTEENGFKFSRTKTKCMHFCRLRNVHHDPVLTIEGTPIPITDQYKFLGIVFDKKLTFIPHINYLKKKCNKAINLLRVVAHTDWGADRETLLKLYRALVRSKLDYGCFIYGSTRTSYIKSLDPIHHTGLRLALGAYRTSPVNSLYSEAHEPPLDLRREKLALQYLLKLKSCPNNPAYDCTFYPKYQELFNMREKTIKPFGLRMKANIEESKIPISSIHNSILPETPPWTMKQTEINLNLKKKSKLNTNPIEYHDELQHIKLQYPDYSFLYTDGSKSNNHTGCAATYNNTTIKKKLTNGASIFTAETIAIDLALDIISEETTKNFIIFTDSLSVLLSLQNQKQENPLIIKLLEKINIISSTKNIIFVWIPSHVGIKGNDRADTAAKKALNLSPENYKIPHTDFRPQIKAHIQRVWQLRWNQYKNSKLYSIKPKLKDRCPNTKRSRREDVILTRLCIGHTNITHSYILNEEPAPECIPCQERLTVEHILVKCTDLAPTRKLYYVENNMEDLFEKVDPINILSYLKKVNLYRKI